MKQNYIYLIILLTISYRVFSMETAEQLVRWFEINEGMAKAIEDNQFAALHFYGMLVDKPIPPSSTSPDPYAKAREIQNEAYNKILFKGDTLEKEKNYENALRVYKNAPDTFAPKIKRIEEIQKLEQEKKENQQKKLLALKSWFNSAETFESTGETDRALNLYKAVITTNLPESSALTDLKQKANKRIEFLTILDETQKLINQQNYLGALDKINRIPPELHTQQKVIEMKNSIEEKIKAIEEKTGFRPKQPTQKQLEAERLRKEERKKTELERLQQQRKLQDDFTWAEQLESIEDTDSALSLYTQIINTNLPESPELISLKRKANTRIAFLTKIKPILDETQKLINQQNYLRALDKINTIRVEDRTQEVTDIKKSIEKKIGQEQLTNKSLQQLLQTLMQLTSKLKLLADYITSHVPL